ncbi:PaaI family thioesterase [Amycolatopsis viridis]|uniref:PaaI family thioesterase n=1 Tax=Amycolatopsis viridis TaxID=185678 RepID=UPI0036F20F15
MPAGRDTFATIDLVTHLVGAARPGEDVEAVADLRHDGRTTQVWDATVTAAGPERRVIAHFRCTQLLMTSRLPRD